ncbi:MAG: hypothetical protein HQL87_04945 [Magnetococcales bacterium]|nr:hypothetical protein [Magnetococcales bacterium]
MHGYSSKKNGWVCVLLIVCLVLVTKVWAEESTQVSFKGDVQPILQYRCLECHRADGPGVAYSGLSLENYEGLMKGTRFGPIVVPGNALVSNLNVLVEGRAGVRMPHNKKRLTPCEIQVLRNWVNQGAKDN